MKQELNLLGNAIDSLNESLRQYQLGEVTNIHLKFSVLLFAHFVELLQAHLLYLNNQEKNFQNPGFSKGTRLLQKHHIYPMPGPLTLNIDSLRKQRNRIQHDAFTYHSSEVRLLISSVLSEISDYANQFGVNLSSLLQSDLKSILKNFADTKQTKLAIVQDKAFALSENGVAYGCVVCKENRVASLIANAIVCQNCGDVTAANA